MYRREDKRNSGGLIAQVPPAAFVPVRRFFVGAIADLIRQLAGRSTNAAKAPACALAARAGPSDPQPDVQP
jgi:hypothetical protein